MARIKAEGGERRVGAAGKRGRRKWSLGEKLRIVQELERMGAAVSEIARRHGAHTSMLTRWRAQYRAGQLGMNGTASAAGCLVPVRTMRDTPRSSGPPREPAPAISAAGAIEAAGEWAAGVHPRDGRCRDAAHGARGALTVMMGLPASVRI